MLITLLILLSFILICVFCCLDLTKKIKLESPFLLTLYFIFMPHLPVFLYCLTKTKKLNLVKYVYGRLFAEQFLGGNAQGCLFEETSKYFKTPLRSNFLGT